jgi:hypothetical protein
MRMYFGADDEKGGFTRRAYLDLSRTLHGLYRDEKKEGMKTRATECLRKALTALKEKETPPKSEDLRTEFDQWHQHACTDIRNCFTEFCFSYGHAQKWLNMTLKYRWFFSDCDPLNGWFDVAHVPVDNFVLCAAREHKIVPLTKQAWSRWSVGEYKAFQEQIRAHARKCEISPLELEHRWWMDQSGA